MDPYYKETLEQMDCLIRFWNDAECQVETRYLDSESLSRRNAKNLLEKLLEALTPLGIYNLVQVSVYYFALCFHAFSFSIETSKLNKPTKARF